jgi:hypothetical protein
LDAEIRWQQGHVGARVSNLSMGGALLEIRRQAITALCERLGRAPTNKIHTLFEPPFVVRLAGGRVAATADMMRIARRPEDSEVVCIACRFRSPLTPDDLHALGIEQRSCTPEAGFLALPPKKMPMQVSVASDARLEVLPRTEDGAAPRATPWPAFVGPLLAMNRAALAFRLSARDAAVVVSRLAARPFDVRVAARGRILWTGEAWLLAVRAGAQDLEVVVHATEEPGDALRSVFRGRTKAFNAEKA